MTDKALRHLLDFELEASGWSTGEIREVRRYLDKGAKDARQRRLCQRYQALRRDVVAKEELAAAKEAKLAERFKFTVYTPDQLDLIPDDAARQRAYDLAAVWSVAEPTVPFPGVLCGEDKMSTDHKINWYVNGQGLPADLPRMICSNGRLTQGSGRGQAYRYRTVTLRTALARIKRGKELFAWGEVR